MRHRFAAVSLERAGLPGGDDDVSWPRVARPPAFPVGRHSLHCGDCLKVLPEIEAGSVDVVVTSPPYNIGLKYGTYEDRRAEQDYLDWLTEVALRVRRVMHPNGSFFLNIAGSGSKPWLPFELLVRLRSIFELQNHITWVKSITTHEDSTGHFKPISGERFLHHNHEHIFHLTKTGKVKLDRLAIGVPYKDKSNIQRRGHAQDLRCRGNTWFIPYQTVQKKSQKFNHPGTFPVDLPRWCIRLHGVGDAVGARSLRGNGDDAAGGRAGRGSGDRDRDGSGLCGGGTRPDRRPDAELQRSRGMRLHPSCAPATA